MSKNISMINNMIPLFKVFMSPDIAKPIERVLLSGWVGQGARVQAFENLLKEHFNWPYLITVNSATSGIHLALHLLKDYPGSEVLTTPFTCIATNAPIINNGLDIKWADIDDTCNASLFDIKRKISDKTKAIMLVHWGGYACDIDEIKELGIPIIEDCAHAWGSKYKNKLVGTSGNISVFSLQAVKHFTSVDGGVVVLPNEELYNRATLLRWYGLDRTKDSFSQDIEELGYKFHMNDVSAEIGMCNYTHISKNIAINQDNARYYIENLKDCDNVELLPLQDDRESSFWLFTILVKRRQEFIEKMRENGIEAKCPHRRNDKYSCLKKYKSNLSNLDRLANYIVCIPCGWWVSQIDRQHIVATIKKGW